MTYRSSIYDTTGHRSIRPRVKTSEEYNVFKLHRKMNDMCVQVDYNIEWATVRLKDNYDVRTQEGRVQVSDVAWL